MLKVLNKYGEKLKAIDVIEVEWNRKFFEPGDFKIYTTADNYNNEIKYVQLDNRTETGIVQKVVYEEKPEGEFVTLSGFFLEKLLDWGTQSKSSIFSLQISSPETIREAIRLLLLTAFYQQTNNLKDSINPKSLQEYERDPYIQPVFYETLVDSYCEMPSQKGDYRINAGEPLGEALINILKQDNLGLQVSPIFNPNKDDNEPLLGLYISTRKGVDRQKEVYFGEAWKNVSKVEFAVDDSNNRSNLVGIQTINEECNFSNSKWLWLDNKWQKCIYEYYRYPKNNPSGLGNCNPEKIIFTHVNDIENGKETLVRNQMQEELKLELLNNYKVENVVVDVMQNNFIYLKDYDLGDICTISVDKSEMQFNTRIIEVHEVYSKNNLEIQVVFGTANKKEYRRVMI